MRVFFGYSANVYEFAEQLSAASLKIRGSPKNHTSLGKTYLLVISQQKSAFTHLIFVDQITLLSCSELVGGFLR